MSRGNSRAAQSTVGARTRSSSRTKGKVPPTRASTPGASHDPALYYQVEDEHGEVKTYFETHPAGNRKARRYRLRHHPYFTKTRTKGREWQSLLKEARSRLVDESLQKNK